MHASLGAVAPFAAVLSAVAWVLAATYSLYPSYAVAIIGLTVVAAAIGAPATVLSVRSMVRLGQLRPELDGLRQRFTNDRAGLNEATMALYRTHGVSPLGGILPNLIAAPMFIAVYQVIRGLTGGAGSADGIKPRFISTSSDLYRDLLGEHSLRTLGVDLAQNGVMALHSGPLAVAAFIGLVAVVILSAVAGQRRMAHLHPDVPRQPGWMAHLVPAVCVPMALAVPLAVTLYYATSSVLRLGVQLVATRGLP